MAKKDVLAGMDKAAEIMAKVAKGEMKIDEAMKMIEAQKQTIAARTRKTNESSLIEDTEQIKALVKATNNKDGVYIVDNGKIVFWPLVDSRGRKAGLYYPMTAAEKKKKDDETAAKKAEADKGTPATEKRATSTTEKRTADPKK